MIVLHTATATAERRPQAHTTRRILVLMTTLLIAIAFVWANLGASNSASAAISIPVVEQCNGQFSGGGQGANCSVVVNNSLNLVTDTQSSEVTVTACSGPAGVPTTVCSTETSTFPSLVTGVNQCNGSADGGGSVLICSVTVVNTITGAVTPTPASIRQCNDATSAIVCTPIGNTTDATIEQCNNSTAADGAGSILTCSVATASTQTTAVPVSIDQCNFSGNGNGSFVTCTASIENRILPVVVVPTPSATPSATPAPTASPTATPVPSATPSTPPTSPATPSDSPTPVPTTPGGGDGGGYDEDTLAATGLDSAAPVALGALILLFAGSLVLLAHNIRGNSASIRENHRAVR
jgi:hypothetical protein